MHGACGTMVFAFMHVAYSYKFSRDVSFAVFVDNLLSTKIKSLATIMYIKIIGNKIVHFGHLQNLHPLKTCTTSINH